MTKIHYLLVNGEVRTVEAIDGKSLMRTALDNGVSGIDGQCGGELACATCHVYLDPKWMHVAGFPSSDEEEMLDMVDARTPRSRLSCQLRVSPACDGLVVEVGPN